MEPSENEIKFAKMRFRIQDVICACFSTAEKCLRLHCVEAVASVDSVVGELRGDTLSGQILIQKRTYKRKENEERVSIEAAIGHTGDWTPIVTVTPSEGTPRQVVYDEKNENGNDELIRIIVSELKEIK